MAVIFVQHLFKMCFGQKNAFLSIKCLLTSSCLLSFMQNDQHLAQILCQMCQKCAKPSMKLYGEVQIIFRTQLFGLSSLLYHFVSFKTFFRSSSISQLLCMQYPGSSCLLYFVYTLISITQNNATTRLNYKDCLHGILSILTSGCND